jgi:hypothetical protein
MEAQKSHLVFKEVLILRNFVRNTFISMYFSMQFLNL